MKRIIIALLILAITGLAAGCGPRLGLVSRSGGTVPEFNQPLETVPVTTPAEQTSPVQTTPPLEQPRPEKLEEQMERTIQATITMEDGGVIVLELYPDLAPQSVRNFVYLARDGYYDGLKYHRIIKDFMIQGGCPDGTGMGNPGYSIRGEFEANGFSNDLSHTRGVLSMARANDPDSAGSQFFIVHGNSTFLDGSYAAFGSVVSGMDVVDRLADTPVVDGNGSVSAENMPVIRSITIDDDIELPEPDRLSR